MSPNPLRTDLPDLQPSVQQEVARLFASPEVRSAFNWFRTQEPQLLHWQIEMAREGHPYVLYLQGKHRGEEETGEMEFRCGPTAESRELSEPEP